MRDFLNGFLVTMIAIGNMTMMYEVCIKDNGLRTVAENTGQCTKCNNKTQVIIKETK